MSTDLNNNSNNGVGSLAKECLQSNNPAKWVAGIALGAIAVAGTAIVEIGKLSK